MDTLNFCRTSTTFFKLLSPIKEGFGYNCTPYMYIFMVVLYVWSLFSLSCLNHLTIDIISCLHGILRTQYNRPLYTKDTVQSPKNLFPYIVFILNLEDNLSIHVQRTQQLNLFCPQSVLSLFGGSTVSILAEAEVWNIHVEDVSPKSRSPSNRWNGMSSSKGLYLPSCYKGVFY